jgi:hypothetical protein
VNDWFRVLVLVEIWCAWGVSVARLTGTEVAHARFMKKVTSWICALAVVACGHLAVGCNAHAIHERADRQIAQAGAAANHAMITPKCFDPAAFSEHCGLLLHYTAKTAFRATLREKKCSGRSAADCEAISRTMIDEWLARRYRYANWDQVADYCSSSSTNCSDPEQFELQLLESHNARIGSHFQATETRIEAARTDALRKNDATAASAARSLVRAALDTEHGGTWCRSYPNNETGELYTYCYK